MLFPLSFAKLLFKSISPSGEAKELICIDLTSILEPSSIELEMKLNKSLTSESLNSLDEILCFPLLKLIIADLVNEFILLKLHSVVLIT